MTWRLVAIRPSALTTKPVPRPWRLPSRPACLITTTDLRASVVICSTDFVAGAAGSTLGFGGEEALVSSSADKTWRSERSTQPATRKPKHEIRNPKQNQTSNGFRISDFRFQISDFMLRISCSRCQGGPCELVRLQFRIDAEIAKHVFADELPVCILQDGADLEPVFFIDVDGHIGNVVFLRLRTGPSQHVTEPVADLVDLAKSQILDTQHPLLLGGLPVPVGLLDGGL